MQEWPIWRILLAGKGIQKTDLDTWTLEDVEKFNALLDMEADHASAHRALITPKE